MLASEPVGTRSQAASDGTRYTGVLAEGKPSPLDNFADATADDGVPAKLIFPDDTKEEQRLEDQGASGVWTESTLLDTRTHERILQDCFTDLLDELAARWP